MIKTRVQSAWFTASLTDQGDSDFHWRLYANCANGVVIGFDSHELIRFLSRSPTDRVLVLPTRYDDQKNSDFVRKIVDEGLTILQENFVEIQDDHVAAGEFLSAWGKHVDPFSVALKHPGLSVESEWRFARKISTVGDGDELAVQKSSDGAWHYWDIGKGELSDCKFNVLPMVTVVVGENAEPTTCSLLSAQLKKCGYGNVPVIQKARRT
jgi:hypothetical protein